MFLCKIVAVDFYRLGAFYDAFASLLLLVRLCVWHMRTLIHVLCACCSFFVFLGRTCQNMMCREISRSCRPPNHTHIRPPTRIPMPALLFLHTNTPIRTVSCPSCMRVWCLVLAVFVFVELALLAIRYVMMFKFSQKIL